MKKYIIGCGLFHPTLTNEQITNTLKTEQTLSCFGTYDEVKNILKEKGHLFVETDIYPNINHGTIFSFDVITGRYFTTFVFEGANPTGQSFNDLYRECKL